MRTLVIDSATEACSVALFEDQEYVAGEFAVLGRGHAERLVPMIAGLPGRGKADRLAVSLGPGSFTGVRIGLAAARALGLAWDADVLGYPTLALVAAMARTGIGEVEVTVCMAGGHGEWFLQDFSRDGLPASALSSLLPAEAATRECAALIAGSRAEALIGLRGDGARGVPVLPDAAQFSLLPSRLLNQELKPIYGRPPDARLPGAAA